MGLFDKILAGQTSETIPFTEQEGFAGVLLATVAIDGYVSDDEAETFMNVVNRMRLFSRQSAEAFSSMMDRLIDLLQQHGYAFMLDKAAEVLPSDLRETAFAQAADLIFADGFVEESEKELLEEIQVKMGVSDDLAMKVVEVLMIKNRG